MDLFTPRISKKKNGRNKFNMSSNVICDGDFGSLKVLKKLKVLPDDSWRIGTNILTKVQPMVAPAFTRIKQNVYAFECDNASVWKHWMDFASNGTEYYDVYGSNVTNQNLDNPWQIPNINMNQLQLISKIANGWAIPVFRLTPSETSTYFKPFLSHSDYFVSDPYASTSGPTENNQLFSIILSLNPRLKEVFGEIPYYRAFWAHTTTSSNSFIKDTSLTLEIGCSPSQFLNIIKHVTLSQSPVESSQIAPSSVNESIYLNSTVSNIYCVRFFCDPSSNDCNPLHSPFKLTKSKQNYLGKIYYDYTYSVNDFTKLTDIYPQKNYDSNHYTLNVLSPFYIQFLPKVVSSLSAVPYKSFQTSSIESYALKPEFTLEASDLTPTFGDLFPSDSQYIHNSCYCLGNPGVLSDIDSKVIIDQCSSSDFNSPFSISDSIYLNDNIVFHGLSRGPVSVCDVPIPVFSDSPHSYKAYTLLNTNLTSSNESRNLGFTDFAWIVYLCKSCYKHMCNMSIQLDGPTVRDFRLYALEDVNALPFFAYSKIYDTYFRNKVVTSPELDFSESNGSAVFHSGIKNYTVIQKTYAPVVPEFYQDAQNLPLNGWEIPFCVTPKNALTSDSVLTRVGSTSLQTAITNNMHYFPITSWFSLFSVLTGYGLRDYIICNMISDRITNGDDNTPISLAVKLVSENFYLPSYYNGLLHLKYQNFNKDYFSSATLDPASGANQVEIGDTVRDLVNAQSEQHFWDLNAWTRSIKKFWESKFGTTPHHGKQDVPQLLGSAHTDINIGEVIQTSQTDSTPQGTRTGLAAAHGRDGLTSHHFAEHGYIFVIVSHTLESQYFQGFDVMDSPERSFLDLPFSDFAGNGNQSILQKEINFNTPATYSLALPYSNKQIGEGSTLQFDGSNGPLFVSHLTNWLGTHNMANGAGVNLNSVFGYIPRWSRYKFSFDECKDSFRHQLDFWHSFRKFFNMPILCHEFVNWELMSDENELNRLFAVTEDDVSGKFFIDAFINADVVRAMPLINIPAVSK